MHTANSGRREQLPHLLAINLIGAVCAGLILNSNLPLTVTHGEVAALAAALVVFTRRNLFFWIPRPCE
jgi:hypothetical protein